MKFKTPWKKKKKKEEKSGGGGKKAPLQHMANTKATFLVHMENILAEPSYGATFIFALEMRPIKSVVAALPVSYRSPSSGR